MPIRLTQVGALGYDPVHVRLPSDSIFSLMRDGLRPPSGAYPVALRVFEYPSCGQVSDPSNPAESDEPVLTG